ncbi:BnaC09g00790D [Brassica napus]|uniref:BnaC07g33910D protein n=1 Tax=Brassica napus TaxID=3708 RepID=A0A078F5E0_BRANA|nr:BnaC07g33930D [Brassica napus]CDY09669.1 BnaC07g33920D [Brassica napus]CDY09670.1 BnaC07g33910D [Brassica napus]CDY21973.1 BnaC09g00790D [Brassica napus]
MKLNDFSLNTLISLTSGEAPPTKSRCTSTAQVRLLRFWEDRNVKRDREGQHSLHGRQGHSHLSHRERLPLKHIQTSFHCWLSVLC